MLTVLENMINDLLKTRVLIHSKTGQRINRVCLYPSFAVLSFGELAMNLSYIQFMENTNLGSILRWKPFEDLAGINDSNLSNEDSHWVQFCLIDKLNISDYDKNMNMLAYLAQYTYYKNNL